MRRLVVALMVAGLVLGVAPVAHSAVNLVAGVETDFIIDKDVKVQEIGKGNYSSQNFDLTTTLLLGDLVELTPKAGLSWSQIDCPFYKSNLELNSNIGFNVGIDAKVHAYKGVVNADLIGAYRYTRVELEDTVYAGVVFDSPYEFITRTHEYEIGAMVSKELNAYGIPLTPSIGLVYSDMLGTFDSDFGWGAEFSRDIDARRNVGLRLGLSVKPTDKLELAVNGSLIDEAAIGVEGSYKF